MARKNLLAGLTEAKLPAGNSGAAVPPPAMPLPSSGARGAIGAVSRSLEQIKAQGVLEIEPNLIDPSLIQDRLTGTAEQHAELVASIREHGQQVPILVRPHPKTEGRYQIAYGRRRLRALAEIGRKVKAIVRPLSDEELVVAQGQENTARTELSFIEKALFASRLEEGGYRRETIMASLSVDKSGLSRLISSATKIPHDMIEAIGPAPKTGRDRWIELATRLAASGAEERARAAMDGPRFTAKESDDRFSTLLAATAAKTPPPSTVAANKASIVKAGDGTPIARVKQDAANLTLALDKKEAGGFASYLVEQLPDLYAAFQRREGKPRNASDGKD